MNKLIFITGGARSGKSRYAVELARQHGSNVVFLATCIPKDDEMRKRIEEHKKNRPSHWKTIEEEKDISSVLKAIGSSYEVVIIDCITHFISNLLLDQIDEVSIKHLIENIANIALNADYMTIIVSNEVGSGLVPNNELGRRFRDITGFANQLIASFAHGVYLMVSGIPIKLKEIKYEKD